MQGGDNNMTVYDTTCCFQWLYTIKTMIFSHVYFIRIATLYSYWLQININFRSDNNLKCLRRTFYYWHIIKTYLFIGLTNLRLHDINARHIRRRRQRQSAVHSIVLTIPTWRIDRVLRADWPASSSLPIRAPNAVAT